MNKKIFLIFILALLIFFISCEKDVEVDLPEIPSRLVANCFFSPDTGFSLNLSQSRSSLDSRSFKDVSNGTVKIFENGTYIGDLQAGDSGRYYNPGILPKAGYNYSFEISAPGFETVRGKSNIPSIATVQNFTFKDSSGLDPYGSAISEINVTFKDDPLTRNYYFFQITAETNFLQYLNPDSFIIKTRQEYVFLKENREESGENSLINGYLFNDDFFNGKEYTLNLYFQNLFWPDSSKPKLQGFLHSVSEDYYKYIKTQNLQLQTGHNPFSEPVRVYNNIENGYGIFAGYASSKFTIK